MKVMIDDLAEEELLEVARLDSLFFLKSRFSFHKVTLKVYPKRQFGSLSDGSARGYLKPYCELPDTLEEAKERLCSDTICKFKARRAIEVEHAVAMGIEINETY